MGNHSEETKKSGFATAGLVLGIIGVCTSFIPIINNLSFVMGILAVIFGIVGFAKKAGKGKVITSVLLGVLAIVITLAAQKAVSDSLDDAINTFNNDMETLTGGKTEELLQTSVDVEIGKFETTKGKYGITDTKLPVNVTNKTSELKTFVVTIEAVDANGNRIDQGNVYADKLNAGQSQTVNIFTLISSDKVEDFENATFKIVEVSMY